MPPWLSFSSLTNPFPPRIFLGLLPFPPLLRSPPSRLPPSQTKKKRFPISVTHFLSPLKLVVSSPRSASTRRRNRSVSAVTAVSSIVVATRTCITIICVRARVYVVRFASWSDRFYYSFLKTHETCERFFERQTAKIRFTFSLLIFVKE